MKGKSSCDGKMEKPKEAPPAPKGKEVAKVPAHLRPELKTGGMRRYG